MKKADSMHEVFKMTVKGNYTGYCKGDFHWPHEGKKEKVSLVYIEKGFLTVFIKNKTLRYEINDILGIYGD